MPRPIRPLLPRAVALATAVVSGCIVGCAHDAKRRSQVPAAETEWIDDAALVGEAVDGTALADPDEASAAVRVTRLDRLLDLLDAARFAEDEYAREAFWAALGGHPTGIGPEATADAVSRLLQEALAIETAAEDASSAAGHALTDDQRAFVRDTIMMLSVDLEHPTTAEALSIRTLAYRTLVQQGHPRVADNARWRIYDHVRGILQGATEVAPGDRMDVAVQALYIERDRVDAFLADTAAHARPKWPTPESLWSLLESQRDALAQLPRWEPVIDRRRQADATLRQTVMTVLPAPRDPAWPMASMPAGTGREESLAPVVSVVAGQATVDVGRPHARTVRLGDDVSPLSTALQSALAQDGRGTVLLVADPKLPSPELHAILRGIRRAQASRLEIAIREPRVDPDDGDVVAALPIEIGRAADRTAGVAAMLQARVHVHLSGRGAVFAIDERPLQARPASARELRALVETLARAYPRERIVKLTLDSNVMLQQLIDLVAALEGGPDRPFAAVGWHAGGPGPSGEAKPAHDRIARLRADAYLAKPSVALEQPYPLPEADQKRLEAFVESLGACVPELEIEPPPQLRLELVFDDGRLVETTPPKLRRVPADRIEALRQCIDDEALPLRLRQHRDRIVIDATLSRGDSE